MICIHLCIYILFKYVCIPRVLCSVCIDYPNYDPDFLGSLPAHHCSPLLMGQVKHVSRWSWKMGSVQELTHTTLGKGRFILYQLAFSLFQWLIFTFLIFKKKHEVSNTVSTSIANTQLCSIYKTSCKFVRYFKCKLQHLKINPSNSDYHPPKPSKPEPWRPDLPASPKSGRSSGLMSWRRWTHSHPIFRLPTMIEIEYLVLLFVQNVTLNLLK